MSNLADKLTEKVQKQKTNGKSQELVLVEEPEVVSYVPEFAVTLTEARNRVSMLQAFVKDMMIQGQDYGLIPGCNKPSLFKPGAEKLCDIFGFSKHLEVINRIEDWDKQFLNYEVKVTLINKRTSFIEAEGVGSANSKEKKFIKQDTFTIANTLLKMAKKRALIDAVLSATRSSGLFTQDIEDLELSTDPHPAKRYASKEQLQEIYALVKELKIPAISAKNILFKHYGVNDSRDLSTEQANNFIIKLKESKN